VRWIVATLIVLAAGALFAKRRDAAHFQGLAFGGRIPIGCVVLEALALLAVGAAWLLLEG
jgi:hypothetical protein